MNYLKKQLKHELIFISKEVDSIGIENLKKLGTWEAALIKDVYTLMKKKKDGKRVSALAIFRFIDDAIGLAAIIANHRNIIKEMQDLSHEEIFLLNEHFQEQLNGIPEKDEKIIETISMMITVLTDGVIDIMSA